MSQPQTSKAPRATKAILTPWQKRMVHMILVGSALVAATGLFLLESDGSSGLAMAALVVHIVVGAVVALAMLVFSIPHAWVQMRRRPVIGLTGALVLGLGLMITYTGALLLLQRSALRPDWIWPVHVYGGLALWVLYAVHRRWGTNPAPWPRLAAATVGLLALGVGLSLVEETGVIESGTVAADPPHSKITTQNRFGIGLTTTPHGKYLADATVLKAVSRCGECHERITEDARRSAHKFSSFNNIFYKGTVVAMREKYPLVDTKWCAGCHDPALLFTGLMDKPDLDFDREEAQLGLTCMACHAIEPRSQLGNGDYVMKGAKIYSWERSKDPKVLAAHDILLKAKPDGHAKSLTPHNITKGVFCATCHKAQVPPELNRWKWLRVQDEYDHWHDSGVSLNNIRSFYHPKEAKRCQDCHMPLVADPKDPAANADGLVRGHLFAAANTALPYMRGDKDMIRRQESFLQNAVRADFTAIVLEPEGEPGEAQRLFAPAYLKPPAVKPGQIVEAHLVLRNFGVGHRFPGGTTDSNEVWVQFEARVGDEAPFFVSGLIDPKTGLVDRRAQFYRTWALNRQGERVVNRIGPDVYTRVYSKWIGPGSADIVRYRIRVPADAKGPVRLRAVLRYRKFMREYIDFLFPDNKMVPHKQMDGSIKAVDVTKLPVIDMWTTELELPVTEQGQVGLPPAPYDVVDPVPRRAAGDIELPKDRERLNDLAIGYLLQGEPDRAIFLFDQVTRIEPDYADGWVNVARARIARRDDQGALEALAKAKEVLPGFPKARHFEATIYGRRRRFEAAEAAYRDALAAFPLDRASLMGLAKAEWEQERPADALRSLERMLAIDPEDWRAWLLAIAVHKALDNVEAADEATRAYRRFKPDDDEPIRAEAARNDDKNLERMWEPIHVHTQPGVPGADD
jgi:tetratricopeptide (TPR) repeat protein